ADTQTHPATAPYLFGTYQSSPFPFATDPANPGMAAMFPYIDFVAGDASATAPGFVTLNPGDILGLAHVTFSVAGRASAGEVVPIALVGGGDTSLSDNNGDPIAFSVLDGTITAAPVPEPTSLVLAGIAALICCACVNARRALV